MLLAIPKPTDEGCISNAKRRVWLPDDVLDLIFETMITDPTLDWSASFKFGGVKRFVKALRKHQPCNYLLVCRQWTQVILNSRSLWTTVLVDPWSLQDLGFDPIQAKVEAHIKRSGKLPLNVVFICGIISYGSNSDTIASQREDQLELLRLLAGDAGQVAARWATCIVAWQGSIKSPKISNPALTFPMPRLTSLSVWGWPMSCFPKGCFSHTPALRHISGDSFTIGSWPAQILSRVLTLEISDKFLDGPFTVLSHLRSVTILKLHIRPLRSWQASLQSKERLNNSPQVSLPNVVEFAVHGEVNAEFLSKFKLEGLRSLSLQLEAELVPESDPLLAAVNAFASPKIARLDFSIAQFWTDCGKPVDIMEWLISFLEALPNVERITGTRHFLSAVLEAKQRKGWILPLADLSHITRSKRVCMPRKAVQFKGPA
jgi:hypothetical protein